MLPPFGRMQVVDYLLQEGARPNTYDCFGIAPIHKAVGHGQVAARAVLQSICLAVPGPTCDAGIDPGGSAGSGAAARRAAPASGWQLQREPAMRDAHRPTALRGEPAPALAETAQSPYALRCNGLGHCPCALSWQAITTHQTALHIACRRYNQGFHMPGAAAVPCPCMKKPRGGAPCWFA